MNARAAIIIPHFNDHARLARCLAALDPPEEVEVIVVDNGSTDPVVLADSRHRLIHENHPGAAAARNRGVSQTDAPLLMFIDADCIPARDWVQVALMSGPGPVGGAVNVFPEGDRPLSGAQAFEAVFAFDNARYIAEEGFSVTANMVVTRAVFDAVGPFRDAVSEDKDWGQRARAAGHPVRHDPALRVAHPSRADWPALARKWRRLTREARELHLSQGRSQAGWGVKALAMPLSAIVHAPRIARASDLTGIEKLRALATLFRLRLMRAIWMLRA